MNNPTNCRYITPDGTKMHSNEMNTFKMHANEHTHVNSGFYLELIARCHHTNHPLAREH